MTRKIYRVAWKKLFRVGNLCSKFARTRKNVWGNVFCSLQHEDTVKNSSCIYNEHLESEVLTFKQKQQIMYR